MPGPGGRAARPGCGPCGHLEGKQVIPAEEMAQKTPPIGLDRLRELGYRIVIFPLSTLLAATGAMRRILLQIAQAGTPVAAIREFPTFAEFVGFIGLPQVHQAEQRYAVKPAETGSETGGRDGSDV